jgi:polynucleotide 5'-hydroxyl-kinase GRC3/NOL9
MAEIAEVFDDWRRLIERIEAEGGLTLLLGATDSGKTTLATWLARTLVGGGRKVAVLDGDIGQSTIGPPATVGLAFLSAGASDQDPVPAALRFVGAVSPAEQMLPLAVAIKRLADKAAAMGAEVILVDTTGLVLGPVGRGLKFHKIELLQPRHVIALQRADELEPILRPFAGRGRMIVHRLPVGSYVKARSWQARRAYRAQRFGDYFRDAPSIEIALRDVAVQGTWLAGERGLDRSDLLSLSTELNTPVLDGRRAHDRAFLLVEGEPSGDGLALARARLGVAVLTITEVGALRGTLLGLADHDNELVSLGLLQRVDPSSGRLLCLTPCRDAAKIRIVHVGALRLDPSGEELVEAIGRDVRP